MPLVNPVVIGGKIVGAYVDETYAITDQGTATLTELLQYILNVLNEGGTLGANNGLNIFEGSVRLGGTLIEDTNIVTNNFNLKVGKDIINGNKTFFVLDYPTQIFYITNVREDFKSAFQVLPDYLNFQVEEDDTDYTGNLSISTTSAFIGLGTYGDPLDTAFWAEPNFLKLVGVRVYANDAAAQADSTFDVGGIYRLTGDPVLRTKI